MQERIESCAVAARGAGRRVNGLTAVWYLFFAPLSLFIFQLLWTAKGVGGYARFRKSVHRAAFLFAVNARIYELIHADPAKLDKIKKEFE